MSEQDKPQSSGQEPTRDETSRGGERVERGERSGGDRSGGGRHGGRRRHQSSSQQQQQQSQSSRRTETVSLNMRELREVVELFSSHGLTELEIENEDIRIRLGKRVGQSAPDSDETFATYTPGLAGLAPKTSATRASSDSAAASGATGGDAAATATATRAENTAEDLHIITAPIVGTFYRKPSPTSDEFVRVGSRVGADTVVCIIEAMKLMNEILAETTGTVEKIYVENGQPVEYGQPLFGIRK